ncbi:MAG: hypothetical protein HY887_08250 [Deltaproteobacteria bacterium]|nr:hypothetical protein [Deltaproteobacteria bacterium]
MPLDSSLIKSDPVIKEVHSSTLRLGLPAVYLVGGAVRNLALSLPLPHDYDFAALSDKKHKLKALAAAVSAAFNGSFFLLDKDAPSYRIAFKLKDAPCTIDLSPVKGRDILEDLNGRDFTVNASAIDIKALFTGRPAVIDPEGGLKHAKKKLLKAVCVRAFDEDPLRCLRAVRLMHQYGFRLTERTRAAIRKKARLMESTSRERVRDELVLIFSGSGTVAALKAMFDLDMMNSVMPEASLWGDASGGYDLLAHALKTVQEAEAVLEGICRGEFAPYTERLVARFAAKSGAMPKDAAFKLGAFLHDAGKPLTLRLLPPPHTRGGRPAGTGLILSPEGRGRGCIQSNSLSPLGRGKGEGHSGALRFWGHDVMGARISREMLLRLRFSRRLALEVSNLVKNHHRLFGLAKLKNPGPRAKAHLFRAVGKDAGLDMLFLSLADARATRGGEDRALYRLIKDMLAFYFETYSRKKEKPLMNGGEIMETFKVPEGRLVGEIMREISEGIEEGRIKNRRQAVAVIKKWLSSRQGR